MSSDAITLRQAAQADEPFLWAMLFEAANMTQDGASSPEPAKADPYLAQYVANWGRESDLGVIAERHGDPLGAAWVRLLIDTAHTYPKAEQGAPELAIAVRPDQIGQGVGGAMLDHLIELARPHFPAIVLSVRETNPARRLYERHGFVAIDEIVNRVGTRSFVMQIRL
jgi:ribosomal protein S18 acetylase RimI-like enzyme